MHASGLVHSNVRAVGQLLALGDGIPAPGRGEGKGENTQRHRWQIPATSAKRQGSTNARVALAFLQAHVPKVRPPDPKHAVREALLFLLGAHQPAGLEIDQVGGRQSGGSLSSNERDFAHRADDVQLSSAGQCARHGSRRIRHLQVARRASLRGRFGSKRPRPGTGPWPCGVTAVACARAQARRISLVATAARPELPGRGDGRRSAGVQQDYHGRRQDTKDEGDRLHLELENRRSRERWNIVRPGRSAGRLVRPCRQQTGTDW